MADIKAGERMEELRKRVRAAFIVFEHKEGSRLLQERDIPTVVRGVGVNPTEEQISQVVGLVKSQLAEETNLVPYETFQQVIVPWLMQNEKLLKLDDFHRLMRAFRAFDPDNKGWIDAQTLKTTLTTQGEVFAPDEAIKLINACADASGRVWYEDYCLSLTGGKAPL